MSERAEVSFDAALMMAIHADAQKELNELPTPAQLKERYPDTSRWDARLQAALHREVSGDRKSTRLNSSHL